MLGRSRGRKLLINGVWISLFVLGVIFYFIQKEHLRTGASNTDTEVRNSFLYRIFSTRKSQSSVLSQSLLPSFSSTESNIEKTQSSDKSIFQKKFKKFQEISGIALKSQKQREDYQQLLQDAEIHEGVLNLLLNPVVVKSEYLFVSTRIDAINFWSEALSWKDNPARSELTENIGHFITQVQFPVGSSDLVKKAIVGDQIEAYMILLRRDPEAANTLKNTIASDLRLVRVIQFATNFYQN